LSTNWVNRQTGLNLSSVLFIGSNPCNAVHSRLLNQATHLLIPHCIGNASLILPKLVISTCSQYCGYFAIIFCAKSALSNELYCGYLVFIFCANSSTFIFPHVAGSFLGKVIVFHGTTVLGVTSVIGCPCMFGVIIGMFCILNVLHHSFGIASITKFIKDHCCFVVVCW